MTQHAIPVVAPYAARSASIERQDGGLSRDGRFWVRALAGEDELAIADGLAEEQSAVEIASRLIGACVADAAGPIGFEAAEALSIGDREVLLRAIHAATFGALIETQVACSDDCGETIAFGLDLDLLSEMPPEPGPMHRIRLGARTIACRVPTGADIRRALSHNGSAAESLALACTDGKVGASEELARALAELDPNAECTLSLACPNCGRTSTLWLDAFELLRRAIAEEGGIMRQVDRLARAYGWSEAAILDLPRDRRRRYCSLVAAENAP
ncbi:hypothetical protein SAMN02745157_3300 [Kaistia soli DSM 19436]|uniref:Uncharacterized protein n=1 Tax=Kaistia soli DSM 19436 TaxID=1122133 RepID=A0A1M5G6M1_9HYPH|nr:hypothetical protein [Kaistia soli]SHF99450.1 hypothetical protein SAMN02745157_3300 [Kaistia soli DSM 19436]